MNVIERLQELRARSPKAFDLACAVLVGLFVGWLVTVTR